ncbi:hypothetical protein KUTeg_010727 [Tegillarca granosa]|uniref:Uncharacterized protein n=1 Tax=Tegillarca granosa TaxID=220873 RepID=A0ABQ9F511_TEGGR|nr:hypothetical protein KUTeg_010727 [Tegillarca granosa]
MVTCCLQVMLNYLDKYAEKNNEILKVLAMLILSHIVDEEDNDKLMDNTGKTSLDWIGLDWIGLDWDGNGLGAINNIIQFISSALKNRHDFCFRGFSIHELMDGLSKLAVNDKNKQKSQKGKNEEDKSMAARVIWTLSFDKEVCKAIVEFKDMMPTLEKLKDSTNKDVEKNVKGALFVLTGQNDVSNQAEYAIKLQKNYIPLMLQKKYRPDGWLGIILGTKLYFDFSGKYQFQKPWEGLLKELKSLKHVEHIDASTSRMLTAQPMTDYDDATDSPVVIPSHHATFRAPPGGQEVSFSPESLKMTPEQVSSWMSNNSLDR